MYLVNEDTMNRMIMFGRKRSLFHHENNVLINQINNHQRFSLKGGMFSQISQAQFSQRLLQLTHRGTTGT